jgi:hypothetical protein
MSLIAEYHGQIQYEDDEKFEQARNQLMKYGWMRNENDYDIVTDPEERTITIPRNEFEDFHKREDDLLRGSIHGILVSTTQDGKFTGWTLTPEGRWCISLNRWALLRGYDKQPNPGELSYPYWCKTVIDDFHAYHSYRTTLEDFSEENWEAVSIDCSTERVAVSSLLQ